jgi:hypothetical protein
MDGGVVMPTFNPLTYKFASANEVLDRSMLDYSDHSRRLLVTLAWNTGGPADKLATDDAYFRATVDELRGGSLQ